jgi:hypothetical protein
LEKLTHLQGLSAFKTLDVGWDSFGGPAAPIFSGAVDPFRRGPPVLEDVTRDLSPEFT